MGDKHRYVYYSYEEWGRGYIGKRTCDCLPEEDVEYFGSFADSEFNPTNKIILRSGYKNAKELVKDEVILHDFYDVARNPHFANRAKQTSTGFDRSGTTPTNETRQKMSAALKGEKHYFFGKNHTEETKQKNRDAHMGKPGPMRGRTQTEEAKRKIREACKGRKSPMSGRNHTEEAKQKNKDAHKDVKWYVNEAGETRHRKIPPGPEWQTGRKWKTDQ